LSLGPSEKLPILFRANYHRRQLIAAALFELLFDKEGRFGYLIPWYTTGASEINLLLQSAKEPDETTRRGEEPLKSVFTVPAQSADIWESNCHWREMTFP